MNQLSLNLVAISIFTVTMATLLGPLIHLSPVVPALATAGALGLATIDTLSWQGQGATLLLDWLAGFSPAHRDRVMRHEAGHFLAAHDLGIPITGYALTAWEAFRQGQPGHGGVRFDAQEIEAAMQQGNIPALLLDRYCTVWMAGMAAEVLAYGDVQGGADDRQALRSLLKQLRFTPDASQQKERWAALRAKTLLHDRQAAYDALVAAMERRASVEECVQAIGPVPAIQTAV